VASLITIPQSAHLLDGHPTEQTRPGIVQIEVDERRKAVFASTCTQNAGGASAQRQQSRRSSAPFNNRPTSPVINKDSDFTYTNKLQQRLEAGPHGA
jgi:hypothetical protein